MREVIKHVVPAAVHSHIHDVVDGTTSGEHNDRDVPDAAFLSTAQLQSGGFVAQRCASVNDWVGGTALPHFFRDLEATPQGGSTVLQSGELDQNQDIRVLDPSFSQSGGQVRETSDTGALFTQSAVLANPFLVQLAGSLRAGANRASRSGPRSALLA